MIDLLNPAYTAMEDAEAAYLTARDAEDSARDFLWEHPTFVSAQARWEATVAATAVAYTTLNTAVQALIAATGSATTEVPA